MPICRDVSDLRSSLFPSHFPFLTCFTLTWGVCSMFEPFLVGGFGLLVVWLAWDIIHALLEVLKHGRPRRA